MSKIKFFFVFFAVFLLNCSYSFFIEIEPEDSNISIDNKVISNNSFYKTDKNKINLKANRYGYKEYNAKFFSYLPYFPKKIKVSLEKEIYSITVDLINGKSELFIANKSYGDTPVTLSLSYGDYNAFFRREGLPDQKILLLVRRNGDYFFKHTNLDIPLKLIGIFKCGKLPKQVLFSPDDRLLFLPLLDDNGFDVFNFETLSLKEHIIVPEYGKQKGFVEGAFIRKNNTFLVSQMTTGKIFEYSVENLKLVRSFNTQGLWSKFIAVSEQKDLIAVSNWLSNDVSIIDYKTGKVIKKIKTEAAPRGLVFDTFSKFLYITTFDGGTFLKVDTSNWEIVGRIAKKGSAMRHVVLLNDNIAFVSDMHALSVYEIDVNKFEIIRSYEVDHNPNSIALKDNRYLFVSARGPNDPVSYLLRSPRNGYLSIIDIEKKELFCKIEGGNQPTGLAISNNGKYLANTNFRDDTSEIYYIGDLK